MLMNLRTSLAQTMGDYLLASLLCVSFLSVSNGNALPDDLNEVIEDCFTKLDITGDDVIKSDEFRKAMATADLDNNGCLTLNEYKDFGSTPQVLAPAIYKRLNYKQTDCVAVEVVEYTLYPWMDKNGNGKVDRHELKHYYSELLKLFYGNSES